MMTAPRSQEQSPQREAAFFYALFLRGHRVEALRRDIDVPRDVFDKWMRAPDYASPFRQTLSQVYQYRKQVLAIFDALVASQATTSRLQ